MSCEIVPKMKFRFFLKKYYQSEVIKKLISLRLFRKASEKKKVFLSAKVIQVAFFELQLGNITS